MNEQISDQVHSCYWNMDLSCAATTLKTLSELFHIEVHPQVIESALGMHGAGKFGAQCGLVEGSLMFIGIYGSQKGIDKEKIEKLCYEFASSFQQQFSSLRCKVLRPQGFRENDPPHLCEEKTTIAVDFSAKFILNGFENLVLEQSLVEKEPY